MGEAWIGGRLVALQDAINEAARMLGTSRFPVVVGLGTDIAGARAAIALAARLGGVIDHMHSDAILRDLDVMREAGVMLTTPNEARLRGDVLLLVGASLPTADPKLLRRLLMEPLGPEIDERIRRVYWLCPGKARMADWGKNAGIQFIGRSPADLPETLAALRARIAGRRIGKVAIPAKVLDDLAGGLKAAKFGVAVWSAAELDVLALEMLCGIVKDLNGNTRFSGLPFPAPDNANGVLQACGWMTGLPMRIGFGRGRPEHDPWRFNAARLIESRETDCALWISAYGAKPDGWAAPVPTIALTGDGSVTSQRPRVHITVGRPGLDHDAVEHLSAAGTISALRATKQSNVPSVASVVKMIDAALPPTKTRRC